MTTNGRRAGRMLALVKQRPGVGNVELDWVPEPACTPDGVKIEVRYTGICGTDIHVFYDRFRNYPPVILGHEFSGTVVEIGAQVDDVKPGDRVTVLGARAVMCGRCEYCRRGYYMFCPVRRGMGHGVNGAFTKFAVVRRDMIYKLPDAVSFKEGAVIEPFASAVQAVEELTGFRPGDTVLVSGPGPIGLLCLALVVAHGCRAIVAGTASDGDRLALASRMGAALTVDVDAESLAGVIARETGGRGVDIAVEASGSAPAVAAAMNAVRKMGAYVQVGIAGKDITIPFDSLLYKQLRMFGSLGHSLSTWDRTMRIIAQRSVDITPVVSHILPLSCWKSAFELCESKRGVKVLLEYDAD
jgi:L-iditol 2-dehydrogenase